VAEERVDKIPVTTYKTVYEDRVDQIPVRVCRTEAVQETERVGRVVEKRVPVSYTLQVPRVVCYRMPLDSCGMPIGPSTSSSWLPPSQPTLATPKSDPASERPYLGLPKPLDPESSASDAAKGTGDGMKPIQSAGPGAAGASSADKKDSSGAAKPEAEKSKDKPPVSVPAPGTDPYLPKPPT
jgi:hypothetical protein